MKKSVKSLFDAMPRHIRVADKKNISSPHFIYSYKGLHEVKETHETPRGFRDRLALKCVQGMRKMFDWATKYSDTEMTEERWLRRAIFLETIAGVPGMVSGMGRHLRSLRSLERDHGRIHHLLEEADNERFHLFIFLNLKRPGILFRTNVIIAQTVFFWFYMAAYLLSPKFSHRFVGYLEEQAIHTYTTMLGHIEDGCIEHWKRTPAPEEVRTYYSLPADATYKEVVLCIRADETIHRQVNHYFSQADESRTVDFEKTYIQEEVERDFKEQYEKQKNTESQKLRKQKLKAQSKSAPPDIEAEK